MSWQIHTPSQSCSGHQNLDVSIGEQILHQRTVDSGHPGVVDGKAIRQQVFQLQVLHGRKCLYYSEREANTENHANPSGFLTMTYFALLCLGSQHFGRCRTFPEEQTQGVLLQAHVPNGSGSLSCLFPGVDEYQYLLGDK